MKVNYRGFEIDVHRGESLAGYDLLYYSIWFVAGLYRYESASGFNDSYLTVRKFIRELKLRIDCWLKDPQEFKERFPPGFKLGKLIIVSTPNPMQRKIYKP